MAYVVMCSECHRFFPMKPIKSDTRQCPSCGNRVKWRALKKREFNTMAESIETAIILNEKKSKKGTFTLKDLTR